MDADLLYNDEELPNNDEQAEGQELFEHYRFTVDKGQSPLRVDKFLTARIEGVSRHRVQQAADAGYVLADNTPVKASYQVKPLEDITVVMPYQRRGVEILPENIPLNILYEDAALMIIDKPAGMVVHPGHGNYSGTMLNAIAYHLQKTGENYFLVHRIDKDTSGVLVVAKTDEAQLFLANQFFHHTSKRLYVALVWGNVTDDEGTIVGNIGRDPNDRMRFKVFADGEQGRHAVTHYKVLERFGYVTLVECRLETGRTHQIRVHMAYLGHPLFSDERYGGDTIRKGTVYAKYKQFINNCFELMPRQALHARMLGFVHPTTKKELIFESPLPADFVAVMDKWRAYAAAKIETD